MVPEEKRYLEGFCKGQVKRKHISPKMFKRKIIQTCRDKFTNVAFWK